MSCFHDIVLNSFGERVQARQNVVINILAAFPDISLTMPLPTEPPENITF